MLGLPNPKKFAPHCLRSYMVTKIANGKGKYLNFFLYFFYSIFNRLFSCIFSVTYIRRE